MHTDDQQRTDSPHVTGQDEQGRPDPPMAGDETVTLLGFLERQRATFGPSSMTQGGMLKHLARFEDDMSTEWLNGRDQLPPWNAVD